MKANAEGMWLSDGTKLTNAVQRTLKFAFMARATRKQKATAERIINAVRAAQGKQWAAMEFAAWLDNAIGADEADGGVLLLVLREFDVLVRTARAKKASDAVTRYSAEDRADYRRRARSFDPVLGMREIARRLQTEIGVPAETGREWLKPPRKKRTRHTKS